MRICITGVAGRIGQAFLALASRQRGLRLRALRRPGNAPPSPGPIEWIEGDIGDRSSCDRLLRDQDVLVHLAWRGVPLASSSYVSGLSDGLLPTLTLLDAVRERERMHIVFPSSGGTVYADRGDCRPHGEEDLCLPISPYAIQKLAAENYLRVLCAAGLASVTILRISTAYGWATTPGAQQGFIDIALFAASSNQPVRLIGNPDNVRDFVHRDDIANALLLAATQLPSAGTAEILNIGSGVGTSVREVVELVEQEIGRPVTIRQEHWATASGLPFHSVLDVSRARDLLGWTPSISLRDGIRMGFANLAGAIQVGVVQVGARQDSAIWYSVSMERLLSRRHGDSVRPSVDNGLAIEVVEVG